LLLTRLAFSAAPDSIILRGFCLFSYALVTCTPATGLSEPQSGEYSNFHIKTTKSYS